MVGRGEWGWLPINPYVSIPLIILVAVSQSTLAPHLTIWGAKPDLMLLAVASWSLLGRASEGVLWSALGGLVLDLLSGVPFGANTVALGLIAGLTRLVFMNVFRLSIVMPLAAAGVSTVVYYVVLLLGLRLSGESVVWADAVLRVVIPSVVVNTAVMPVVFGGVRWLHKHTGPEEIGW